MTTPAEKSASNLSSNTNIPQTDSPREASQSQSSEDALTPNRRMAPSEQDQSLVLREATGPQSASLVNVEPHVNVEQQNAEPQQALPQSVETVPNFPNLEDIWHDVNVFLSLDDSAKLGIQNETMIHFLNYGLAMASANFRPFRVPQISPESINPLLQKYPCLAVCPTEGNQYLLAAHMSNVNETTINIVSQRIAEIIREGHQHMYAIELLSFYSDFKQAMTHPQSNKVFDNLYQLIREPMMALLRKYVPEENVAKSFEVSPAELDRVFSDPTEHSAVNDGVRMIEFAFNSPLSLACFEKMFANVPNEIKTLVAETTLNKGPQDTNPSIEIKQKRHFLRREAANFARVREYDTQAVSNVLQNAELLIQVSAHAKHKHKQRGVLLVNPADYVQLINCLKHTPLEVLQGVSDFEKRLQELDRGLHNLGRKAFNFALTYRNRVIRAENINSEEVATQLKDEADREENLESKKDDYLQRFKAITDFLSTSTTIKNWQAIKEELKPLVLEEMAIDLDQNALKGEELLSFIETSDEALSQKNTKGQIKQFKERITEFIQQKLNETHFDDVEGLITHLESIFAKQKALQDTLEEINIPFDEQDTLASNDKNTPSLEIDEAKTREIHLDFLNFMLKQSNKILDDIKPKLIEAGYYLKNNKMREYIEELIEAIAERREDASNVIQLMSSSFDEAKKSEAADQNKEKASGKNLKGVKNRSAQIKPEVNRYLSKTDTRFHQSILDRLEIASDLKRHSTKIQALLQQKDHSIAIYDAQPLEKTLVESRKRLKEMKNLYQRHFEDTQELYRNRLAVLKDKELEKSQTAQSIKILKSTEPRANYQLKVFKADGLKLVTHKDTNAIVVKELPNKNGFGIRIYEHDGEFTTYKKNDLPQELINAIGDQADITDLAGNQDFARFILKKLNHDQTEALKAAKKRKLTDLITLRNNLSTLKQSILFEKKRLRGTEFHSEKWNPNRLAELESQLIDLDQTLSIIRRLQLAHGKAVANKQFMQMDQSTLGSLQQEKKASLAKTEKLNERIQQLNEQQQGQISVKEFAGCFPEASPFFSERLWRLNEAKGDFLSSHLSQSDLLLLNFTASLLNHSYGEQFRLILEASFKNLAFDSNLNQVMFKPTHGDDRQVVGFELNHHLRALGHKTLESKALGLKEAAPKSSEVAKAIVNNTTDQETQAVIPFELSSAKKKKKKKKLFKSQLSVPTFDLSSEVDLIKRNLAAVKTLIHNKQYVDLPAYLREIYGSLTTIEKNQNTNVEGHDAQWMLERNKLKTEEGQQWISDYNLLCQLHQAMLDVERTSLDRATVEKYIPLEQHEIKKITNIQDQLASTLSQMQFNVDNLAPGLANAFPISRAEIGRLTMIDQYYDGYLGNLNTTPLNVLFLSEPLNRSGIETVLVQNFPNIFNHLQGNYELLGQIHSTIDNNPIESAVSFANTLQLTPQGPSQIYGGDPESLALQNQPETNILPVGILNEEELISTFTLLINKNLDQDGRDALDKSLKFYTAQNQLETIFKVTDQLGISNRVVRELVNMASYIKPYSVHVLKEMPSELKGQELTITQEDKAHFRDYDFVNLIALVKSCEDKSQLPQLKVYLKDNYPEYTDTVIGCMLNMVDGSLSEGNQNDAANYLIAFREKHQSYLNS